MDVPQWLLDLLAMCGFTLEEQADLIRKWKERGRPQAFGPTISELEIAHAVRDRTKEPDLGRVLIALGLVGEREVMQARAQEAGIGFVDLDRVRIEPDAIASVKADTVTREQSIPVKIEGTTLWLATSALPASDLAKRLSEETGYRVIPVLALPASIDEAIAKYYPD